MQRVELLFQHLLRVTKAVLRLTERVRAGAGRCFAANVSHPHPALGGHLFRLVVAVIGKCIGCWFKQLRRFLFGTSRELELDGGRFLLLELEASGGGFGRGRWFLEVETNFGYDWRGWWSILSFVI